MITCFIGMLRALVHNRLQIYPIDGLQIRSLNWFRMVSLRPYADRGIWQIFGKCLLVKLEIKVPSFQQWYSMDLAHKSYIWYVTAKDHSKVFLHFSLMCMNFQVWGEEIKPVLRTSSLTNPSEVAYIRINGSVLVVSANSKTLSSHNFIIWAIDEFGIIAWKLIAISRHPSIKFDLQ